MHKTIRKGFAMKNTLKRISWLLILVMMLSFLVSCQSDEIITETNPTETTEVETVEKTELTEKTDIETESETEIRLETETRSESETLSETETESETETKFVTETLSETETKLETETVSEMETITETEKESETDAEEPLNILILPEKLFEQGKKANGFSKVQLSEDGEYVSFYGNNSGPEAYFTVFNENTKATGQYLVFKYRFPAENTLKKVSLQFYLSHEKSSATSEAEALNGIPAVADGNWNIIVVDLSEVKPSGGFEPAADGTYSAKFLRFDCLNQKTPTTDCIQIAYVGMADDLDSILEYNKNIEYIGMQDEPHGEVYYISTATGEKLEELSTETEQAETGAVVVPEIITRVLCFDSVNGKAYGPFLEGNALNATNGIMSDANGLLKVNGWGVVRSGVESYSYRLNGGEMVSFNPAQYENVDAAISGDDGFIQNYLTIERELDEYDKVYGTFHGTNGRFNLVIDLSSFHDEIVAVEIITELVDGTELLLAYLEVNVGHTHWLNATSVYRDQPGKIDFDCDYPDCDHITTVDCEHPLENVVVNRLIADDPATYLVNCNKCMKNDIRMTGITQEKYKVYLPDDFMTLKSKTWTFTRPESGAGDIPYVNATAANHQLGLVFKKSASVPALTNVGKFVAVLYRGRENSNSLNLILGSDATATVGSDILPVTALNLTCDETWNLVVYDFSNSVSFNKDYVEIFYIHTGEGNGADLDLAYIGFFSSEAKAIEYYEGYAAKYLAYDEENCAHEFKGHRTVADPENEGSFLDEEFCYLCDAITDSIVHDCLLIGDLSGPTAEKGKDGHYYRCNMCHSIAYYEFHEFTPSTLVKGSNGKFVGSCNICGVEGYSYTDNLFVTAKTIYNTDKYSKITKSYTNTTDAPYGCMTVASVTEGSNTWDRWMHLYRGNETVKTGKYLVLRYMLPASDQDKVTLAAYAGTVQGGNTLGSGNGDTLSLTFKATGKWEILFHDLSLNIDTKNGHKYIPDSDGNYYGRYLRLNVVEGMQISFAAVVDDLGEATQLALAYGGESEFANAQGAVKTTTHFDKWAVSGWGISTTGMVGVSISAPLEDVSYPYTYRTVKQTAANEHYVYLKSKETPFETGQYFILRYKLASTAGDISFLMQSYSDIKTPAAPTLGSESVKIKAHQAFSTDYDGYVIAVYDLSTFKTAYPGITVDGVTKYYANRLRISVPGDMQISFVATTDDIQDIQAFIKDHGFEAECAHTVRQWVATPGTNQESDTCLACGQVFDTRGSWYLLMEGPFYERVISAKAYKGSSCSVYDGAGKLDLTATTVGVNNGWAWLGVNSGALTMVYSDNGGVSWKEFNALTMPEAGDTTGSTAAGKGVINCPMGYKLSAYTINTSEISMADAKVHGIVYGCIPNFNAAYYEKGKTIDPSIVISFFKIPAESITFPAQ